jgi:Flp pilus assembly protein TadG
VEFTLVLPLLLVLLLGVLEFGRVMNYWIDETHLANVAARWAAVNRNPGPEATLARSVQRQADTAELRDGGSSSIPSGAQVCVEFPEGTSVGDPVEATVSVDWNWMPIFNFDAASTTLTGSATMRLEAVPGSDIGGCS